MFIYLHPISLTPHAAARADPDEKKWDSADLSRRNPVHLPSPLAVAERRADEMLKHSVRGQYAPTRMNGDTANP